MADRSEVVEELLPLTPVVFHTLVSLAPGGRHGYAIAQDVEEQTGGRVRMGPGTLYGALRRMAGQGLIEEYQPEVDRSVHRERRRYYRLTGFGGRVLRAELRRLDETLALARRRLPAEEAGLA